MLSSLKKWARKEENVPGKNRPAGMHTMSSDLQRKFSKGVQYNLKIVIRGDRNTGKTCLWHRLQGHKFVEEYVPTPEIQATSIQWNYKATDDIVKVDVWDVVDQGKQKNSNPATLTLTHTEEDDDPHMLDASFLDVYKGAHAVIMVFDITKKWTFQYIERELPRVPPHIPVLILANHRDMGSHRVISLDEVQYLSENTDRPPGSAGIFFLESSMKNNFGLKYVHKFFNLPFLLVQRESLLKQLETNHLDVESCLEELVYEPGSEEQSFDYFIKLLDEQKKGKKPPAKSGDLPLPANVENHEKPSPTQSNGQQSSAISDMPEKKSTKPPNSLHIKSPSNKEKEMATPEAKNSGLFSPSMMTTASSPTEQSQKQAEPEKRGFMSRFFRSSTNAPEKQEKTKSEESNVGNETTAAASHVINPPTVKNIDDFVPDVGGTDNFFNEIPDTNHDKRHVDDADYSTSEDEGDNPMVSGFQEELDSDDQLPTVVSGELPVGQLLRDNCLESHKVYSYSDSDDDYVKSNQIKSAKASQRPASTRSKPVSHINNDYKEEDKKLQSFAIESDSSSENETPVIMADAESLSDEDYLHSEGTGIYTKKINTNLDTSHLKSFKELSTTNSEEVDGVKSKGDIAPVSKKQEDKMEDVELVPQLYQDKNKKKKETKQELASSSDEETLNEMVSTVIEDISSDENASCSKKPSNKDKTKPSENEPKENIAGDTETPVGLNLQLQSSDFDFLEKISSKSAVEKPVAPNEAPARKSKSRKKHKDTKSPTEGGEKKHKHHKKKKSKSKNDEGVNGDETKGSRKKKTGTTKTGSTKTQDDKDLEDFLGGGEGYESL